MSFILDLCFNRQLPIEKSFHKICPSLKILSKPRNVKEAEVFQEKMTSSEYTSLVWEILTIYTSFVPKINILCTGK